jgi:ATP-dependent Lhr-like helicase
MPDKELLQDREIAKRIPRAWAAFFESFGRLTPVQRASIPLIADGKDTLVTSPTASGKTEAVCAPLVERNYGSRDPWTILYISPTRALVNDLYYRLYDPLGRLSLSVKRRTGDHRDNLGEAHVILTTPESFDSLLCRGRVGNGDGHLLANVVAVVIDEVHLLHGNPRGEQIKWCLERLRRLRKQAVAEGWAKNSKLQVVALSATIPDPKVVADRFLTNGEIVRVDGGRSLEVIAPAGPVSSAEDAVLSYLDSLSVPEKVLVFTNSRKRADVLTAELREPLAKLGYRAETHHGSLSRDQRTSTEEAVRNAEKIVVFATSTLEIGIDIGDIDLVVLDGPAPDVKSLLQRMGRGNRRTDKTRVMPCAGSYLEAVIHSAMIQAADEGWLGASEYGPEYAVMKQQIASYIFQSARRSRSRRGVEDLLAKHVSENLGKDLIDRMLSSEELIEDEYGLRLGEVWLDRSVSGQIHSNIEGPQGLTVVDESTGQPIASGLRSVPNPASSMKIAGNPLEVRSWGDRKIEVRRLKDSKVLEGNWGYVSRAWFKGADQPQSVRRYLGISENIWPWVEIGNERHIFHFGGSRRKAFLQLVAGDEKLKVNEWYITISDSQIGKPAWATDIKEWRVDLSVLDSLDSLENTLGRPKANQTLPVDARVDEIKGWLMIDEETNYLNDSLWTHDVDLETSDLLIALLQ